MRNLIYADDMDIPLIETLVSLAGKIMDSPGEYCEKMKGKKLATLFFEPSTRTRLSFEAAMLELGGSVLGFSDAAQSSATKGESVADTLRVVSFYADICAIRHPKEGSALVAAGASSIPVINAGDGGRQHPTQTLTDILTISREKGRLTNLTIGMCGDLMFGRTVHSLVKTMSLFKGVRFVFVSPKELVVPDYITAELKRAGVPFIETRNLEETIGQMDILYMTRVQRERFFNEEEYLRLKDAYILDKQKLDGAKKDLAVLHPLPRVNEISTEIDDDPRALYFKQAMYGKYIRMALILYLMEAV